MKNFIRIHFHRIIIFVLLGILFLALIGASYAVQGKYYGQMENNLVNKFFVRYQKMEAEQIAFKLEHQINETINILKTASEFKRLKEISSSCQSDQRDFLEQLIVSLKDKADYVGLIDKDGIVVCAPNIKNMEGQSVASYPNIQEAMVGNRPVISRSLINPIGIKMITVVVQIFSDQGERIGLLSAAIGLDGNLYNKLTSDFSFSPSTYNILIDDDGTIIYHPNQDLVMKNINSEDAQKFFGKSGDVKNIFRKMLLGEKGYDFYILEGKNKIIGYAPAKLINGDRFWSVGATADVKEYQYMTEPFFVKGLWANLALIFLGFALVVLAAYLMRLLDSACANRERERESKNSAKN